MANQVIWITASAGTGKTTALINRYKTLLQTCKPEQIIGITFTINAAEEIKERLTGIGFVDDDGPRIDAFRIQTIHSLCHQLLSTYTEKNISILDSNEKGVLLDQALRMALNEQTELTKRLAQRFSFYRLQNLMEKIAVHLPDRQSVMDDKPRDFDFADVSGVFEPIEPKPEIVAILEKMGNDTNYIDVFLTKTGEIRKRILDAITAKQHPDLASIMQDEAHRLYALMQERAAQEWLYDNNLMHQLVDRVWDHYKNLKQNCLDYDELLNAVQTLLEDDVVRYDICRSIHHVLLDEAQDTNPKQWRIIELLTQHLFDDPTTNKSFFVVGDHKQSIYGFQNASPEFMAQQKQKYKSIVGEGFIEESLETNYRSVGNVCDYIQAQCLSPSVLVARDHVGFVLEVNDFDDALEKFLKDPPFLPSQNRTLELQDIMILCRKRDKTYHGIIERYGNQVRFEQTRLLSELPDVQTLMYRALLLAEPDNGYAEYKLKLSDVISEDRETVYPGPHATSHAKKEQPVCSINFFGSLKRLEIPDRPAAFRDYISVLELIATTLSHNPLLLNAVLEFVARHNITTPKSLYWWLRAYPYTLKTISTDDPNTMRLLTMHGAKGLQAPVVFVFNDWTPYNQQDIWWNYNTMDFVIPPTKSVHHPTLAMIREQNRAQQVAEDARLRYVAFTRAMDVLVNVQEKI